MNCVLAGSWFIKVDKFDVDKQYLMCREGFLSHDLLQATFGQSILIVWHIMKSAFMY